MPRDITSEPIQRGRVVLKPRTKRAAQDLLADELIYALQTRPNTFSRGHTYLYDNRIGQYYFTKWGPLFLMMGHRECGCSGISLGFRNKFRVWKAFKEWRDRNKPLAAVPHIHEAMRLFRANNM